MQDPGQQQILAAAVLRHLTSAARCAGLADARLPPGGDLLGDTTAVALLHRLLDMEARYVYEPLHAMCTSVMLEL